MINFNWVKRDGDLTSIDGIVEELLTRTKHGDIAWAPRGGESARVDAGFRCHDEAGNVLEFFRRCDEDGGKGRHVLVSSGGGGTGTVELPWTKYVLLFRAAADSLDGVTPPKASESERHRGPFL